MGDHRRVTQHMVRDGAGDDAMQAASSAADPHLRPQQTQAHLHEAMIEVRQDHIVATARRMWSKTMGRISPVCGWGRPLQRDQLGLRSSGT